MLKDERCSWKWKRKEIIHRKWKSSVNVIIFLCLSQRNDTAIHHPHAHSTLNLLRGQKTREERDDFLGTLEGFTFVTNQDSKIKFYHEISLKWCQLLPRSFWEISESLHSDSWETVSWPRGKGATQLAVLSVWSLLPLVTGGSRCQLVRLAEVTSVATIRSPRHNGWKVLEQGTRVLGASWSRVNVAWYTVHSSERGKQDHNWNDLWKIHRKVAKFFLFHGYLSAVT